MRRFIATISIGGFALAATACAAPPHLSEDFGESHRANVDAMVANPSAGTQPTPVGLGPSTSEHVLDNYAEGQRAQEHPRPKRSRGTGILVGDLQD